MAVPAGFFVTGNSAPFFARVFTARDTGHGRQEERTYYQMAVPKNLPGAERWKNLRSLGMVIRCRMIRAFPETVFIPEVWNTDLR